MRFSRSIHLLMCLFQDLNIHHSDWLIYSSGTDRPGELCYNPKLPYSFPTCILECESHSPALLGFFLMLTMAFPPLGNSDHMVFSVSIEFLSNSKRDAPFHRIAHDYFCAVVTVFVIIWDIFHRKISLNSVLMVLLVIFRLELMYISVIVSIRSSLFHVCGFQLLMLLP